MPATHLVFDLDDTLYPERSHAVGGFRAAGEWARSALGIEGLEDDLTRHLDDGRLGQSFVLALAARRPGYSPDELQSLIRAWREHVPSLALFPDAARLLERLDGRPLGLITDGSAQIQRGKVAALAIARHFHTIVYTGALGPDRAFHKPHPKSYLMMEAALGQPGDRFVYVGDNPSKDCVTPNARGWTSVMIVRPEHAGHRIHKAASVAVGGAPHLKIESLDELAPRLGITL